MEILLIVIGVMIIILLILVLYFILKRRSGLVEGIDNSRELSELKQQNNNLNKTINDLRVEQKDSIALSKSEITNFLQQQNNSNLQTQNETAKELRTLLQSIEIKSEPIKEVQSNVNDLRTLFSKNNRAGSAGEFILERLIIGALGDNVNHINYENQFKIKKKNPDGGALIVDMLIKGNGGNVTNLAIDSKFPVASFDRLSKVEKSSPEYAIIEKEFKTNVNKRVDETSKYVSDEDRIPYTIMFIPSDSIYALLNSDYKELMEAAYKKRVIPAGPSTLVAMIYSIDKYMSLFDTITAADKKIESIEKAIKYMENYDDSIDKLEKDLKTTLRDIDDVRKKEKSMKSLYEKHLADKRK